MSPTNTFIHRSLNSWYSRFAILLVLVSACTTEPTQQPKPYFTDLQTKSNTYTVQPGDTLYNIAKRYGKTVPELVRWNELKPPYTLQPGQLLLVQESSNTNKTCPNCKQISRGNRPLPVETTTPPKHCYPPVPWQWPTQPLSVAENLSPTGQRGINLSGPNGQPVYTAAAGTVTYNQSMKNGNYYLIIQHNQAFSSVYANLRNPQVNPGKRVAAGQLIATLGTDTLNRPVLYFEIRCWDKTINSLDYLPKE